MMQIQANMTGVNVNRPVNREATALGAALILPVLQQVFGRIRQKLRQTVRLIKFFVPSMEESKRNEMYANWKRAVERSRNWEKIILAG